MTIGVRAAAGTAIAIILLSIVGVCPAAATSSGGNGMIAYVHQVGEEGPSQIWTVDPAGGNARQLTEFASGASSPVWSPDGRELAFQVNGGFEGGAIWIASADGSETRRVTPADGASYSSPSFSPDGNRLALAREKEKGGSGIYEIGVDGTGLHQLRSGGTSPAWSPNGGEIAFEVAEGASQIWVMDADGTNPRQLTSTPHFHGYPDWSPDGEWIAYIANEEGDQAGAIYEIRPDGSGWERLHDNPSGGDTERVAWSPDGTKLVFSTYLGSGGGAPFTYRLHTIARDGSGEVEVTHDLRADSDPAWQPVLEDTEAPQLDELSFEPAEVDVTSADQHVTVKAHVTDDISGSQRPIVEFRSPDGSQEAQTILNRVSGTNLDGTYEGVATIHRFAQSGTWKIHSVFIADEVGNVNVLKTAQLEADGFPVAVQVQSRPDTEAPQLDELSFEPAEVDVTSADQHVTVKAHVTDDISGSQRPIVEFRSPDGSQEAQTILNRVSGTNLDGTYEGVATIHRFAQSGTWKIHSVFIADEVGNVNVLKTAQLEADGFPVAVQVQSRPDTEAPQLDELSFEPAEVDVTSADQHVTVKAHVTDDISGSQRPIVEFRSPDGSQEAQTILNRVSGTNLDGTYEGVATIHRFAQSGTWKIHSVFIADEVGNVNVLKTAQLEADGFPVAVQVDPPPSVVGIDPAAGAEAGGTVVEISGTGLASATSVRFGSAAASNFTVHSASSITAVAPPGVGTVDVVVTTPNGTSETSPADRFRYSPPVSLVSSPNPSTHGQKVTFTAKILPLSAGAPVPLGTVAFVDGSTTLGVANLSKGTATFNTTALGAGKHEVVAKYSGDSNFGPGTSEVVSQTVSKASTQLGLTSSLNPAPYGSAGSLKATVKAVAPGAGVPAGTITFSEGPTILGTVQLSGMNATYPLKALPPGTHEISASYSGDPNNEPSASTAVSQSIVKASTETVLTSSLNPAPFGSSGTLKATVKAIAPGAGTPPGTVTFSEGETVLATVPLSGATAKYALKALPPGTHEISASYDGDSNYEISEASIGQTIVKASTDLALTSTKNPAPFGSSGTLKATVKAIAPGAGTPLGTVTFSEGETVLATVPLSGNVATYPLKSLAIGTHELVATYSGSSNYESSKGSISQAISP